MSTASRRGGKGLIEVMNNYNIFLAFSPSFCPVERLRRTSAISLCCWPPRLDPPCLPAPATIFFFKRQPTLRPPPFLSISSHFSSGLQGFFFFLYLCHCICIESRDCFAAASSRLATIEIPRYPIDFSVFQLTSGSPLAAEPT